MKKSASIFAIPLAIGPIIQSVRLRVTVSVIRGTAKSLITSGTIFLTILFSNQAANATERIIGITDDV